MVRIPNIYVIAKVVPGLQTIHWHHVFELHDCDTSSLSTVQQHIHKRKKHWFSAQKQPSIFKWVVTWKWSKQPIFLASIDTFQGNPVPMISSIWYRWIIALFQSVLIGKGLLNGLVSRHSHKNRSITYQQGSVLHHCFHAFARRDTAGKRGAIIKLPTKQRFLTANNEPSEIEKIPAAIAGMATVCSFLSAAISRSHAQVLGVWISYKLCCDCLCPSVCPFVCLPVRKSAVAEEKHVTLQGYSFISGPSCSKSGQLYPADKSLTIE